MNTKNKYKKKNLKNHRIAHNEYWIHKKYITMPGDKNKLFQRPYFKIWPTLLNGWIGLSPTQDVFPMEWNFLSYFLA